MNSLKTDTYEPERISMVHIGQGNWIPLDTVEFLNIEENIHGEDVVTFNHKGKTYQSKVIIKTYL
jgi:hypothetical protein